MDLNRLSGFGAIFATLLVAGCASFAELRPADVKIADVWHATLPHDGQTTGLVSWWSTFNDPSLTSLIGYAQTENASLDSAAADIEKARATLGSARAGLLPGFDGSGSIKRSGTDGDAANRVAASTTSGAGLDASWEIDLFGKNRQTSEAARLRVHQQIANWHDARVSLAAEVADYYVQYRACRQLENAYRGELVSQKETIRATKTAADSGLTSTADLALARATAASSSSTLTAQRAECEVMVKSLAQLTGGDEARVRQLLAKGKAGIPAPKSLRIAAVPAEALHRDRLLRRRHRRAGTGGRGIDRRCRRRKSRSLSKPEPCRLGDGQHIDADGRVGAVVLRSGADHPGFRWRITPGLSQKCNR